MALTLIGALTLPSYATIGAADGSAFVTKAEFDAALSDFNARLTTFEAGINSKIESQVSSYLDRNGIWNGKDQLPTAGYITIPKITWKSYPQEFGWFASMKTENCQTAILQFTKSGLCNMQYRVGCRVGSGFTKWHATAGGYTTTNRKTDLTAYGSYSTGSGKYCEYTIQNYYWSYVWLLTKTKQTSMPYSWVQDLMNDGWTLAAEYDVITNDAIGNTSTGTWQTSFSARMSGYFRFPGFSANQYFFVSKGDWLNLVIAFTSTCSDTNNIEGCFSVSEKASYTEDYRRITKCTVY